MKRIGYLVLCFCAAARAAVQSPRQPPRLAADSAPPPKPGLIRILLYRSVTLALDAVLLGTAAILLVLRLAPKSTLSTLEGPLLGSGNEQQTDPAEQEQRNLVSEAADPDLQPIFLQNRDMATTPRYTEEPAETEQLYAALPAEAGSDLHSRSITAPAPATASRFSALREVLFANGLPDLQRIGRRGELPDYRDPQELYMDLDMDMPPAEPQSPHAEHHQAAGAAPSEPPGRTVSRLSEEAALPPPLPADLPALPLFRPIRREPKPHRPRLERGEALDGIRILPSRPGQYRRKS